MDPVPTSVVAAIGCSAAAGKNPWVPLALIFLLAAPESAPELLIDAKLHAALHALGPAELLWGLGIAFLVLAVLESLADKLPFVERWLVPVSTAWRPFASVAVATLIAWSVAEAPPGETLAAAQPAVLRAQSDYLLAGSTFALTVVAGAVYGWLATIGKTGTRLLLSFVPVPSLRFAHSLLDDLFAWVVSAVALAFGESTVVLVAALLYLLAGLVVGPLLTRISWIHFRIGVALFRKGWRRLRGLPPRPPPTPRWVLGLLGGRGVDPARAACLPCYAYRAPGVGRFRAGHLVFAPDAVYFATRVRLRPRLVAFEEAALARLGLAETATNRIITVSRRKTGGGLEEVAFTLFPAVADEVLPVLERGAVETALVRVRPISESARAGLAGYADRGRSVRYLPAAEAGSLRAQALLTIGAAVGLGVLTAGTFIPIGLGYAASPYLRRFLVGLALSAYLTLCVVGSLGVAWPVAVLYAVLLNTVALRDLARSAIRARVDGFVDRRAFMSVVSGRVWVPRARVAGERDLHRPGDALPLTDGPWRAVLAVLASEETPPATTSAGAVPT